MNIRGRIFQTKGTVIYRASKSPREALDWFVEGLGWRDLTGKKSIKV